MTKTDWYAGQSPWVHTGHRTDPTVRRFKGVTLHGDMRFDVPFITQITDDLWQGGCVTGLALPPFIRHVVSLFPWEHYDFGDNDEPPLSELRVNMRDSEEQTLENVEPLAVWVNHCRATGPVLVHCQAGLNRSALIVAKALHLSGFGDGQTILAHLREVRSPAVLCNKGFEREVLSWR
jgi:protein-tyrosine phosphatase